MMQHQDQVRGSLIGGAIGDALGEPIEFALESTIFSKYGERGLTEYLLNKGTGTAVISDDTQMTLFTAYGLLQADTARAMGDTEITAVDGVTQAYLNWLLTQFSSYDEVHADVPDVDDCWLMRFPELYAHRAPGHTCITALHTIREGDVVENHSKGCGGVMRVAPVALRYNEDVDYATLDKLGGNVAAITHKHSLGYMSAATQTHILRGIIYRDMPLREAVVEARDIMQILYAGDKHLQELVDILNLALDLSTNDKADLDNIHDLGAGWVAEENLGIAVYCALRYEDDFSNGIIAAVNHGGDADSTGAVAGNILGALCGYDAIEKKWKKDLELHDVIVTLADDLARPCPVSQENPDADPVWMDRYGGKRLETE